MKTNWIWLPEEGHEIDAYGRFRRILTVVAKKPVLRIAASSNFAVRLNGHVIQGSQYSDLPGHPTYSDLSLSEAWKRGKNTLEIQVYVLGRNSLTTAILPPGLWAEIRDGAKRLDATDGTWECVLDTAYANGRGQQLTGQLGNTFAYDANATKGYNWQSARIVEGAAPVQRPPAAPVLHERPAPVARVVQAGQFFRREDNGEKTPAELISTDFLQSHVVDSGNVTEGTKDLQSWHYDSPTPFLLAPENAMQFPFTWPVLSDGANGWYCIVDLGIEFTGWLTVTMEAEKGAVLDIAHGEHLQDGRVRAAIGGRNYADRIICAGGLLHFTHRLRRIGARYLELHVTGTAVPPRVGYLGIVPMLRNLPKPTEILCPDRLLMKLDRTAIRTLAVCQHEHFEDCPMREQGLYPYDSRNQALYGYPVWGNYEFVASCYRLLAGNWNEGAQTLQMTSPGCIHLSIPIFGLVWVTACWELLLHSGNPKLVAPVLPVMDRLLKCVLSKTIDTPAGKLYHPGKHETIWNFCEWQPGICRMESDYQAPYNLYLAEALRAAAKIGAVLGNCPGLDTPKALEAEADRLCRVCDAFFWDETQGLYRTEANADESFHEHTQMLAIYNGVAKGEHLKRLCTALGSKKLYESTFSALPYWVRAMRMLPPKYTQQILPRLRRLYEPEVLAGSSTLWETEQGGEDFYFAGSLCHGWSSIPAWYLRTGILGIEPTSPGYETFRFRPDLIPELQHMKGSIVTPHGLITAEWHRNDDGSYHTQILSCPQECNQE